MKNKEIIMKILKLKNSNSTKILKNYDHYFERRYIEIFNAISYNKKYVSRVFKFFVLKQKKKSIISSCNQYITSII